LQGAVESSIPGDRAFAGDIRFATIALPGTVAAVSAHALPSDTVVKVKDGPKTAIILAWIEKRLDAFAL
jgi:hypothetical protein